MKKTLDTNAIANDLKGASLFFKRPTPPVPGVLPARHEPVDPSPPARPQEAVAAPHDAPEEGLASRPSRPSRTEGTPRTTGRPVRRFMVRHSFEIYQDQIESLRRLALEERMAGGTGSMSQLVRSALDWIITKKRGEGE